MNIADLSATVSLLLAVSLATERWVAIVKTLFPALAKEKIDADGNTDLVEDRPRRLVVQAVALAGAWLVAAFVAGKGDLASGKAFIGLMNAGTLAIPVPVVALLASGGSAFWTQVLQFAGAVKDVAVTRKASETMESRAKAGVIGDRRLRLLSQLEADPPRQLGERAEGE